MLKLKLILTLIVLVIIYGLVWIIIAILNKQDTDNDKKSEKTKNIIDIIEYNNSK